MDILSECHIAELMTAYLNLADQVTDLHAALRTLTQQHALTDDPDLGSAEHLS